MIRHVFLGNSRDYMVELADGTQLRVVTSADQSVPQGEKVWLELPPQRCRVLVGIEIADFKAGRRCSETENIRRKRCRNETVPA